jgi:hypothetical protein
LGSFISIQANVGLGGVNIIGDAANEPSIAVDPSQPNRMAIGWRHFSTVASNFREAGWAFSQDGGRSWTFTGVLTPGVFRSDPVLGFDANGNFYFNSLKVVGSAFTCDVFTSINHGVSWGSPVYAHGGDKQWMVVDRTGGVSDGYIYCAWSPAAGCCGTNTFTRSIDDAASFATPTGIPSTPAWGTLDVAPDGTLYLSGLDLDKPSAFLVSKSTNARDAAMSPTFSTTAVDMGGTAVFFAGASTPNPGGLLGQVWIAVDPSLGATAGYIYMLCSVDPQGLDPLDVHFVRSTDGGVNWSAPVRVNDDAGNAWQWFGTMSVSPDGRIDAIWNDSRNTGVHNQSELYHSSSTDGGVTWSTNEKLSPAWNSHVGWPNQDKIGDYYGMISDRVGAHIAWAATFNGEQDVYYLRVGDYDCNVNGVADSLDIALGGSSDNDLNGIPDECESIATEAGHDRPARYQLFQNAPNPFNPTTTIRFELPVGSHIKLQIFDVRGRLVRLDAPGFSDKRKMLLLK